MEANERKTTFDKYYPTNRNRICEGNITREIYSMFIECEYIMCISLGNLQRKI